MREAMTDTKALIARLREPTEYLPRTLQEREEAADAIEASEARVKKMEAVRDECLAVIKLAIEIDDHYDRLEFLKGWNEGDTSEWPEFRAALSPAPEQEPSHDNK